MDEKNQNLPPDGSGQDPPIEKVHTTGEMATFDKEKIDRVLDSFLKEQELLKERERQQELKKIRKKRAKKLVKLFSFLGLALFVLVIIAIHPETRRLYHNYQEAQVPQEEYLIPYNYSPDMEILPFASELALYDSANLRALKKDGTEVFDIPFVIASWDMETSDHMIYLLDKIEKVLYFIDHKGEFINKVELSNIPSKLYAGKAGNLAVHYRSDAGVEGVMMFDKNGKLLEDQTYPKTTLTFVTINDQNQTTVHGMYRVDPKLSNYTYRYSAKGKLIFSKSFEDVIFVKQYENDSTIAMVDINRIDFYDKSKNETVYTLESLIPLQQVAYDSEKEEIYFLDKRNKLRVINMQGEITGEKYFQTEYKSMVIHHGNLLMLGEDFVRKEYKEIKYPKKIERFFKLDDYLVFILKGEIRMTNKLE